MHGFQRRVLEVAVAVAALAIAGCGGGGGSTSSTGTPAQAAASQLATGVITGFGSVYVDGVKLDDSAVGAVAEQADGSTKPAVLQLGQRLRATHDGSGKASRLVVDAAVIGRVSAVDAVQGTLQVAGQLVRVNADPATGVVTQFGGYDSTAAGRYSALADVQAGDLAEVHGSPLLQGGQWAVQATRIDKRSSITAVRVAGVVSGLVNTTDTRTFALGALTVDFAAALAAGKVTAVERLADGVAVRVFGDAAGVVNGKLTAASVRIGGDREGLEPSTRLQLGGVVSARDAGAGTFQLEGTTIRVGTASIEPLGATIVDGSWVKVDGSVGLDGSIDATRVAVRQNNVAADLARVRLIGPITGYQDANTFIVRDVPVDASGVAAADRTACTALADGVQINVAAVMQAGTDVVFAEELKCEAPPAGRPLADHAAGAIAAIDAATNTLSLTDRDGQTRVVRWTDATAFVGRDLVAASSLVLGARVQAEGVLDGTALVAKVISQDGARPVDRFRERPPQAPGQQADRVEAQQNWSSYRSMQRPAPRR